jgi:hypothetical protein
VQWAILVKRFTRHADTAMVQVDPLAFDLVLLVAVAGALLVWYRFVERKRLIQDLPTSKVRGVALGLNELSGTAVCDRPEISPHGSYECVWWKATYYVQQGDNWKKTGDRTGGSVYFELEDETGRIPIWPRHAELRGKQSYEGSYTTRATDASLVQRHIAGAGGAARKVVEEVIPLGTPIYVLGTARVPDERVRPEIGADPRGQHPFIVHVGTEADALWVERVAVLVSFLAAVGAAGGLGWRVEEFWGAWAGVFAVVGLMGALNFVFSYNNLVLLAQRAVAAWGLIDVQLRRRHDLLPHLVSATSAMRDHEQQVQLALAELRAVASTTLAATPSDSGVRMASASLQKEAAVVGQLLALAERYPQLSAHRAFLRLQVELTDTEDRIALARGFYNNAVTAFRDRARLFPGAIVAAFLPYDLAVRFSGDEVAPPLVNRAQAMAPAVRSSATRSGG